jgi:hypothetical protein
MIQPLSCDKNAVVQSRQTKLLTTLPRAKTYFETATNMAMSEFASNGRAGVSKIYLMITDGLPTNKAAAEKSFVEAKKQGIKVLMLGIGFWATVKPAPEIWLSYPQINVEDGFEFLDERLDAVCSPAVIINSNRQTTQTTAHGFAVLGARRCWCLARASGTAQRRESRNSRRLTTPL